MAARHDEAAMGDSTTPPKEDGQIVGPKDPSQLSQNNGSIQGGGTSDLRHGESGCHRHDDNNNINYLCFASSQFSPQVQGDADNKYEFG